MLFVNRFRSSGSLFWFLILCCLMTIWLGNVVAQEPSKIAAWQPSESQQAFIDEVSALLPEHQAVRVIEKLVELNPGFNGKASQKINGDDVVEFAFNSDSVTQIWPLRVFENLEVLRCNGSFRQKGSLTDLSSLAGAKLKRFDCRDTKVTDLSGLQGMPLNHLDVSRTRVSSLTPLAGMKLVHLECFNTPVSDLSPVKGMPLRYLNCFGTRVTDLSPLKGAPLRDIDLAHTRIADLSPLADSPLTRIQCYSTSVADLSPLREMPIKNLRCKRTKVTDLSPILDTPISSLDIDEDVLKGNAGGLKTMLSLTSINGQSAQGYLQKLNPKPAMKDVAKPLPIQNGKPPIASTTAAAELETAKEEFKEKTVAAMKSIAELFEKEKETALRKGDPATAKFLDQQRERLQLSSILPTLVATTKFEKEIAIALIAIRRAYQKAISESGRNGDSKRAAALKAEAEALVKPFLFDGRRVYRREGNAFYAIQPDRSWLETKPKGNYVQFSEKARTREYIELKSKATDVRVRLYFDRVSLKNGYYPWGHFKKGAWVR